MSPRVTVSTLFFCNGFTIGGWALHVALAQKRLHADLGWFGLALTGMAIGSVVSMPLTGALIGRKGSAGLLRVVTPLCFAGFLLPVLASNLACFAMALVVFGAFNGAMDVAMNAHGLAVEGQLRRPVMSGFHALWSLGGLLGAGLGALLLARVTPWQHAGIVAVLMVALTFYMNRFLLPGETDKGRAAAHFAWPTRGTVGLGLLCFIALMGEGAVIDWAAIHLRDTYKVSDDAAGLGYAVFAGAMATTRFAGDSFRARFGAVALVRASACVTLMGMLGALSAPSALLSVIGYGLAGLGIGNLAPVLFAGGGRREPDNPARGIAAVTTLGYVGFLAGPPLIGIIGRAAGLPLALGVIVLGMALIAVTARAAASADG